MGVLPSSRLSGAVFSGIVGGSAVLFCLIGLAVAMRLVFQQGLSLIFGGNWTVTVLAMMILTFAGVGAGVWLRRSS